MLNDGPVDFVTGDHLAELTMLILFRSRRKDPSRGHATTFLRQLEPVLGRVVEPGARVVVNADVGFWARTDEGLGEYLRSRHVDVPTSLL